MTGFYLNTSFLFFIFVFHIPAKNGNKNAAIIPFLIRKTTLKKVYLPIVKNYGYN